MEQGTGFFLYKGLKKPLVFKGLKGKYIYYAGGAFASTLVLSIILSNVMGFFLGLILAVFIGGGSIWYTFKLQKTKGLYNKTKNFDEIYIVPAKIKLPYVKNPLVERVREKAEAKSDNKQPKEKKAFFSRNKKKVKDEKARI